MTQWEKKKRTMPLRICRSTTNPSRGSVRSASSTYTSASMGTARACVAVTNIAGLIKGGVTMIVFEILYYLLIVILEG